MESLSRARAVSTVSLSVAAALAAMSGEAHSAQHTSSEINFALPQYLTQGQSIFGAIRLGSQYDGWIVSSATVSASFMDNADTYSTATAYSNTTLLYSYQTYEGSTYYCCGLSTCHYDNYESHEWYNTIATTTSIDPPETGSLQIFGTSVNASSPPFDQGTIYTGQSTMEEVAYPYWDRFYYVTNYLHVYGNHGSFTASLTLDPTALGILNFLGGLPFTVSAQQGDFLLTGMQISFDAAPAIPEPGPAALLAAGLGLLAFSWRRRYAALDCRSAGFAPARS